MIKYLLFALRTIIFTALVWAALSIIDFYFVRIAPNYIYFPLGKMILIFVIASAAILTVMRAIAGFLTQLAYIISPSRMVSIIVIDTTFVIWALYNIVLIWNTFYLRYYNVIIGLTLVSLLVVQLVIVIAAKANEID